MSLQKQGTQDLEEESSRVDVGEPWAKLLSLNKMKIASKELTEKEITIGRSATNTIQIDDIRLSGTHCKIVFHPDTLIATLTDLSTNGTFLGEQKIGKGNEVSIRSGDEIYLLHKSKVSQEQIIGYAYFQVKVAEQKSSISDKINSEINTANDEKLKKMDLLSEEFHCPICDDLIYQAVTLMPCLHNFCGSCFSDWMAKQKTCPTCRKDVDQVSRNAMINNVIEKYLDCHPEKKRPQAEYQAMEANNKIKQDLIKFNVTAPAATLVIQPLPQRGGRGGKASRGRGSQAQPQTRLQRQVSDYSASSEDDVPVNINDKSCLSCKMDINGFKCKPRGQVHLKCVNCATNMPRMDNDQRLNETFPHRCQLCNHYVCNLYNQACQRVATRRTLYRTSNIPVPNNVDIQCFRQNLIEHKFFNDYLTANNITTQNIFKHMLDTYISKDLFRYVENKRINPNPTADIDIVIRPNTPICNQCVNSFWQQLIFRYRITIKDKLSSEAKNRSICWYGINCKTMAHNQQHAQKLDHMVEQQKF